MSDVIKSYSDLIVWQKAITLVEEIYRLVKFLPKEETYALSDQMRRAAVSIPSNIAEGQGRTGKKDFSHFMSIALGSSYELQTQLVICNKLGYIPESETMLAEGLLNEVCKMLNSLLKKLGGTSSSH